MVMTEDMTQFFQTDDFATAVDYYRYVSATDTYTKVATVNGIIEDPDIIEGTETQIIRPSIQITLSADYDYRPREYIDTDSYYATAGKPLYMILTAQKEGTGLVTLELTKDY